MAELPDLAANAFDSVIKQGGKKMLDPLLARFKDMAPSRVQEMLEAQSLGEVQRAAQALKGHCSSLGLSALEDLCFGILEAKTLAEAKPHIAQVQARLPKALAALAKARALI